MSDKMLVPPPRCVSRTEVTLVMEIPKMEPGYEYQLQYKEPHDDWASATVLPATSTQAMLDELNPSCSYHIRVMAKASNASSSERIYSEEVAVDTEVPGCTPTPTCCSSCTIQ
ncbi:hypothetical protein H310_06807 [Aphanomyces invadans]|uniref:Fibronectin type-III domain-containing protein n=1 Tax=Aphanomyces invadans TaxID=157072 RepID=A0A024U6H5_9STRA|nr:hypothetical protein H310_06807 [Aphanomyces invadans]ETW01218.1 hypothetical protein H310_06807 [Aphanomyces invadans]|eukprot:XP_008870216.1 hypothetical protein H310_06807 [Aphanomyces invadans]